MRSPGIKAQQLLLTDPVRQRLIAAARCHFFAHGFRNVTMDDLAQELGMSKKTLYACFPSKIALVEAVLLDKIGRIDADLERIAAESAVDFSGRSIISWRACKDTWRRFNRRSCGTCSARCRRCSRWSRTVAAT